jgi:gluconate 5-dehydrogenase
MSLDDWNKVISADLTSVFMCMQEGIKLMLRQKSGSIINVASIFGLQGAFPGVFFNSNYCAAKAGVIGLTKQGASEYGRDGIRVNVIVPGFHTGTRLARPQFGTQTEEEAKDTEEKLKSITPMGRVATADELKGMAIYLASDASGFVTGASFIEDGGWSCW